MDLEKAYDHVNWDFLLYMLRRCGFRKKWCIWKAHCMLNSTPTGLFNSFRGLRQRDPLSPLSVFLMDDLGKMISAAISGELLDGFLVDNVVFSHLLFSDDILIFYGAFPTHLRLLWSLFHCFEAASG